jgi:hypothetical protein
VDSDPPPDPHQIKIRIRIRIKEISSIRNLIRINLQMTGYNIWNMSLFEHSFKGFELLFGSYLANDPDPHQDEKSDPNPLPHQRKIRVRIRIK